MDDLKVMRRDDWYMMLMVSSTRYLPSRCCGRMIYYMYDGDEWCDDHRCVKMTHWGERCAKLANGTDMCSQCFSQEVKEFCYATADLVA